MPKRTLAEEIALGNPNHRKIVGVVDDSIEPQKELNGGANSCLSAASQAAIAIATYNYQAELLKLIEPPEDENLNTDAKRVWKKLSAGLINSGFLTPSEQFIFVEYCRYVGIAMETESKLISGEVPEGDIEKSREECNKCWQRSRDIAPLLGMGFKARAEAEKARMQLEKDRVRAATITRPSASKPAEETQTPDDEFAEFDQMVN